MAKHILFVCEICKFSATQKQHEGLFGGEHLLKQLSDFSPKQTISEQIEIRPVECMDACQHPCVAVLSCASKPTYLFTNLPPLESAEALLWLCDRYIEREDGSVRWREFPDVLKSTMFARIPPVVEENQV
jgi:predicted metal-binding protein